jgi:hypothetical protein
MSLAVVLDVYNGILYSFTNKIMYEWLSSLNTGLPGFINLVPLAKIICSLMQHHVGYENADFILMARVAVRLDPFATAARVHAAFV